MSPLKFVEPQSAGSTVNMILYGPPGNGKTVGACSAPGPCLVLNAEGAGGLHYARRHHGADHIREVTFEGKQTLVDLVNHLKSGKEDAGTVVVDSVGEVHGMLLQELGGQRPSLQNFGDANNLVERFVRALRDLPINVVLVAHEQVDDQDGEVTRRPSTGGKKLPETLMAMVDVVAYCGVVAETEDSPRRYVAQLVTDRGRRAKDRSGLLGAARDVDLTEWCSVWREASDIPDLERDGEPAPSAGQLDLLMRLLRNVGADASDQETTRAYVAETMTGGLVGSCSELLAKLKDKDQRGPAAAEVVGKAAEWASKHSDLPADTEGLPTEKAA